MHFHIEIELEGQPTRFHFEPSTVSGEEPGYRVYAERAAEPLEFRMSKVEGQWHITKETQPQWLTEAEPLLIDAIREREYPQDV
jgi:hypothetical protein